MGNSGHKCSQGHFHSTPDQMNACDEECKTSICTIDTGNIIVKVEYNAATGRKKSNGRVKGPTGLTEEQKVEFIEEMIGKARDMAGVPKSGPGQATILPGVSVRINRCSTFIELSKAKEKGLAYEEDDVEDGAYVKTPGGLKFMPVSQVKEKDLPTVNVETSAA